MTLLCSNHPNRRGRIFIHVSADEVRSDVRLKFDERFFFAGEDLDLDIGKTILECFAIIPQAITVVIAGWVQPIPPRTFGEAQHLKGIFEEVVA